MSYKNAALQRAYQTQWLRKRREAWLAENGPCVVCGSSLDLEMDHKDPETKSPLLRSGTSRIWSWSPARRIKELAKCQVLCGECHKKKHGAPHGSITRYKAPHNCRCPLCREANTASKYVQRIRRIQRRDFPSEAA